MKVSAMASDCPTAESLPREPMARLLAVMAWLRDRRHGCPWDVEQTFRTIAPYTIEEAYEVADAIERDDLAKIEEELGELRAELAASTVDQARLADELGDVLFAVANLARHCTVDPEAALRATNDKFERRFRYIERRLAEVGRQPVDATLEQME